MKKKLLCGVMVLSILLIITGCGSNKNQSSINDNSNSNSSSTSEYPELSAVLSEVESKYKQETFKDSKTGKTIEYNIYLPDNYDSSKKYPLLVFIADSSLVGRGTTASLEQGYGGV
ncbi:MAG: pyrroline-5-carboxylate reductase, partial [Bacilli bacterium]|nr:pyrroline-5-carboxylate reductase [Bacilli bacterium]